MLGILWRSRIKLGKEAIVLCWKGQDIVNIADIAEKVAAEHSLTKSVAEGA